MEINPEWMGLTNQQLDILLIIYDLKANSQHIKASNIITEYKTRFNRDLQRQNLFSQLKVLLDLGIIEKRDNSAYDINKHKMQSILEKKRDMLKHDFTSLDQFSQDIDKRFSEMLTEPSKPIVTYLNPQLYNETTASLLNRSHVFYIDTPFPNIAYTERLSRSIGRERFIKNLRENCFVNRKLKVNYLTNLNIDLTFRRALEAFNNDGRLAYLECRKVIKNLRAQIREPNLDIRYLDVLPGPHMYIFENSKSMELILSLRYSNTPRGFVMPRGAREPYGGVHIISSDVASQAKEVYMSSFNQGLRLNSPKGEEILWLVETNFEILYRNYKKSLKHFKKLS